MDTGLVVMSRREIERAHVMRAIQERRLTQKQAASQLVLSVRQVERLFARYKRDGPTGLVSRRRGQRNHVLPDGLREEALCIVRTRYPDFGPTLAHEKLLEVHGLRMSVETLRKWMTQDGIWKTRAQRKKRIQQPRHRRDCYGELVQIDGSDHHWFEDRGPRSVLLVYVDDATSRLMELRFVDSESTFDYFASTASYLNRHGKPVAFYSDRATIFRATGSEKRKEGASTQFSRALSELNIEIICANTPQAKGRVERAHLTLQDRLVKELRLRGILSPETANAYVPEFIVDYNKRFAKPPMSDHDAHRPLRADEDLALIFTLQEDRKVSKELTLHYRRGVYLIESSPETLKLRGKRCRVHTHADGRIELRYCGRGLRFKPFDENRRVTQANIVSSKRLGDVLQRIQAKQRKRDGERLASKSVTLRQKKQIRTARAQADGPPGSP